MLWPDSRKAYNTTRLKMIINEHFATNMPLAQNRREINDHLTPSNEPTTREKTDAGVPFQTDAGVLFQVNARLRYMLAGEINKTRRYRRAIRDNNENMRGRKGTRVKKGNNVNRQMLKRHLKMRVTHSKIRNTGEATSKMAAGHPGYFTAEGKKKTNDIPTFSSDDESDPLEIPFQTIPWWTRPWKIQAGWKPTIIVPPHVHPLDPRGQTNICLLYTSPSPRDS